MITNNSTIEINSELLVIAREARGYTQSQLAKSLGVSQGRISKIEMESIGCPSELLEQIAIELYLPIDFFTQQRKTYGLPLSVHGYFRKKQSLGKRDVGRIHATVNICRFNIDDLLRSADINTENRIPIIDPEEYNGNISEIARVMRQHWLLPRGTIRNIVETIENSGGIIVECDFGTDKVDALSQRITGFPPMIFIRKDMSGDRQRFTVAHELAHLILHHINPSANMEDEANEFAAEFLMPESEIKLDLKSLTLEKLAMLKRKWKVSMQAILYRANQLDTISNNQYRYLWMQISKAGYRKREPINIDIEKPSLLRELISTHLGELGYTKEQLAHALKLNSEEFNKMYFANPASMHLRAVK